MHVTHRSCQQWDLLDRCRLLKCVENDLALPLSKSDRFRGTVLGIIVQRLVLRFGRWIPVVTRRVNAMVVVPEPPRIPREPA